MAGKKCTKIQKTRAGPLLCLFDSVLVCCRRRGLLKLIDDVKTSANYQLQGKHNDIFLFLQRLGSNI